MTDHPYTNPGDGRSECQTCGKWIWPVTHSCKGVPVTVAAWNRKLDELAEEWHESSTSVEQLIEAAKSSPECFKCHEPITEFSEVRIVRVRVDGKPIDVWVHADHAGPPGWEIDGES